MIPTLCLTEFQSLHQGDAFCTSARTLTPRQFQRLERFAESYERRLGIKVFQYGARHSLVAQNFVGVIHLEAFQVEILPKIDAPASRIRQNLLRMVAATLDLQLHDPQLGQLDRSEHSTLELLVRLFCERLWEAVHKGLVRRYEGSTANLSVLRGRLNVAQQLRHNLARRDRLYCSFDEFTPDNPLNQALKAALKVLVKIVQTEASTRSLSELMFCFCDVSDVPTSSIRWDGLSTDRLSSRFAPLLSMARMFVEGASPDLTSGAGDGFAVLFDMNKLFEEYVGRQVQSLTAMTRLTTRLQGPRRHLALRDSGAPCFELRPDIVILSESDCAVVIDTKWKRLKAKTQGESISSTDLYQMFAYAKQYNCHAVILLYPHHGELGDWTPCRDSYRFIDQSGFPHSQWLHVASLPLDDLNVATSRLRSVLEQVGGRPSGFNEALAQLGHRSQNIPS